MDNSHWQERKLKAFARGMGNIFPIFVDRARNAELWDVNGKRYIDFGSGIAVLNTGHSHPEIVDAVKSQIEAFSHTCVMVTPYGSAVELAERLNALVPIDNARTIFLSTGAEAVENAIKIARAKTGRPGVIAFSGGFHGRTNLCMGLTGKVVPYKKGFGPFTPEIYHAPFPAEYLGVSAGDSIEALESLFRNDIEPGRVAAIIIEPIQGEGGFYPAPEGFLGRVREVCDRHGIVMISDEIQTGFGRTGKMFATEYEDVQPDIMTLAKGIAGGYPLAAVVGRQEVMDAPEPGGLGGTYAASPPACAAALAVLDVIEKESLVERANEIGARLKAGLQELAERFPGRVGDIRGKGAMVAMELVRDNDPGQPDAELTAAMVKKAGESGLLIISCGVRSNAIRVLAPLTIPFKHLREGLEILGEVMADCV
jgi:4-aminobutyrate aminotransferase/(S)-3-amino-2-methylpropionate transaminase